MAIKKETLTVKDLTAKVEHYLAELVEKQIDVEAMINTSIEDAVSAEVPSNEDKVLILLYTMGAYFSGADEFKFIITWWDSQGDPQALTHIPTHHLTSDLDVMPLQWRSLIQYRVADRISHGLSNSVCLDPNRPRSQTTILDAVPGEIRTIQIQVGTHRTFRWDRPPYSYLNLGVVIADIRDNMAAARGALVNLPSLSCALYSVEWNNMRYASQSQYTALWWLLLDWSNLVIAGRSVEGSTISISDNHGLDDGSISERTHDVIAGEFLSGGIHPHAQHEGSSIGVACDIVTLMLDVLAAPSVDVKLGKVECFVRIRYPSGELRSIDRVV